MVIPVLISALASTVVSTFLWPFLPKRGRLELLSQTATSRTVFFKRVGISFGAEALSLFVFAYLLAMLDIASFTGAWELVIWLWAGFFIPSLVFAVLAGRESWKNIPIHALARLIAFLVGVSILIISMS